MEFLNILCFADAELNFIGKIVQWLYNIVGNYGWTVVLFTLFLKIITSPLDFWQRYTMKKNSLKLTGVQEVLSKVEKQFAGDQRRLNEEKQKILKKQGYSAFASCLPMIITMAVFIFMFGGLNSYSEYINLKNYTQLNQCYITEYNARYEENKLTMSTNDAAAAATVSAQSAVGQYYKDNIQESFMWVKNLWRADTWVKQMADENTFVNGGMGVKALEGEAKANFNPLVYKNIYEGVLQSNPGYFADIDAEGIMQRNDKGELKAGWNGLIILPILSVIVSLLSTKVTQMQQKAKGGVDINGAQAQQTNKMMGFMMPIMFGIFGFLYTGAFALYMVCNSGITLLVNVATNGMIDKMAMKRLTAQSQEKKASYMR